MSYMQLGEDVLQGKELQYIFPMLHVAHQKGEEGGQHQPVCAHQARDEADSEESDLEALIRLAQLGDDRVAQVLVRGVAIGAEALVARDRRGGRRHAEREHEAGGAVPRERAGEAEQRGAERRDAAELDEQLA